VSTACSVGFAVVPEPAARNERSQATVCDAPIALLLPSLAGGGAERMTINLARGLAECGHRVDLVLGQASGPYRSLVPDGVRSVDLNRRQMLTALGPLIGYLRRERPRALIAAMNHASIVALWATRLAGTETPVFAGVRSHLSVEARRSNLLGDRLMPLLARTFFPGAKAVIAVSDGVADDLRDRVGLDPNLIRVIDNPVVTPEIAALAAEQPPHPWLIEPALPVILGAGRLTAQKDFATLIRAFAQARKACSARLVIIGEGPERATLEALIRSLGLADAVALPGFQTNPFAWMRAADLFVLSSAWEGLPGVLIQAMACGTPVVSTDCPSGPREILCAGEAALGPLVPVGDSAGLAQAILSTLSEPPPVDSLRRRAADFSMHTVATQYLELLDART
jgi:glycosyltransferase involved in cell wall biosynthesis